MVTFKMVPSIAHANVTICISFVDDTVPNYCVDLNFLEAGQEFGLAKTSTTRRLTGGTDVLKKQLGVMSYFKGN